MHQLAIITAIRQLFTREEEQPASEALKKTPIISILNRILQLEANEEEFYFIKLEALWLLICLSMADSDDLKFMMLSSYPEGTEQPDQSQIDQNEAERDFERNKSLVLIGVESMLKFGLNNLDGTDMKVLHLVAHLYANLVVTAPEFAHKVLKETSILHMFHCILSNDLLNTSEPSLVHSVVNTLLHLA